MPAIPNIGIENIGTGKHTLRVIKGKIELPCWNGYFLAERPNNLIKTTTVADGQIALWVDGMINNDGSYSIDAEQVNAYRFLVENQEHMRQRIIEELKLRFPALLENEYASWDHEDGGLPHLSALTHGFDFKNYIGPSSISIGEDVKDDSAYVKWHFQCLWDPEHGFEVVTHKDRVIDVGPEADVFSINKDNGTYEALQQELEQKEWKKPVKKKWWQFW